jgi:hypothetical protein
MILYHGSNIARHSIDLSKCKPFKDFGRGFYLTTLPEQALRMAARTTRLYGGNPVVSAFEFDEQTIEGLRVLKFESPSLQWARFVMNNRSRVLADAKSLETNSDSKYDIVMGPVANDDLTLLFRQFIEGTIDLNTLARNMEYKNLTNQYSFHTDAAARLLKPKGDLT